MYVWITRHPQVVQSLISKDDIKFMFDDQTEPQQVPRLLLPVSVRELNNSLVSNPSYGGLMKILLSVILHYVHFSHLKSV